MPNILFQGYALTDAGAAIVGATVDLLDRNTTTPVRATTTTAADGLWAISHATEGRFDIRITNGSSVRWHKWDARLQLDTLEVSALRVRNPAFTFEYDLVPAAITADRQLNLPLLTATDTVVVLAMAQTFLTGVKTFNSSILAIRNPADTFSYTVVASAITAARNLTVPLITADDTLAVLGLAQTFSAVKTFSAIPVLSGGAISFPATQVASAGVNDLDDYEEGTFTPTLTFVTPGDLSVAYSVQAGFYTKIGRQVHLSININTSTFTHTTASGAAIVGGYPFTSGSGSNLFNAGACNWQGITKASYTNISFVTGASEATSVLAASGSGQAQANVAAADMPSAGAVTIRGSISYSV